MEFRGFYPPLISGKLSYKAAQFWGQKNAMKR